MNQDTASPGTDRLLIIDSNVPTVEVWKRFMFDLPIEVETLPSLSSAMDRLAKQNWEANPCSAVLLELKLVDGSGLDLLQLMTDARPRPRVAVITSGLDGTTAMTVSEHCLFALPKPIDRAALLRVVNFLTRRDTYRDRVLRFAKRHLLSQRETQLVLSAVSGLNNDEIAADLGCDRSTVSTYWSRIFKKTSTNCQRGVLALIIRSWSSPRRSMPSQPLIDTDIGSGTTPS
jgi:DNA-binding NarL/FixJ family response regulator